MDLKKVQVNEISCQMESLKNQYRTLNSSVVTLYSKEKPPHNYHARASQESNFIFQQRKSCMSKTITIFKYRKRYKPYIFKKDSGVFYKIKKPEIMRKYSMPILRNIDYYTTLNSKTKSSDEIISRKSNPFKMNYIVNVTSGAGHSYYLRNSFFKPSYKIYRCQFNIQEESCCCSCNSDAMFEVMKSLYDCYKKKNCDHCNCILCGHLPREERRLGEMRKSAVGIKEVSEKKMKDRRKTKAKKVKDVSSLLKDKSAAEKEKILEDLVASGVPLPEGKTKSEKELIKKVKARRLSAEGIAPEAEAIISKKKIPSAKLRKAKEAGLLTPLEGKTPKQKENILRGLAMNGIPLPAGKTSSDKKLIDKVRKDVGLPPEPLTASDKKKYNNALESGLITPLEGKSPSEKEKILKGLANLGVQLPEGRSSSEKALVAKVKAEAQVPLEIAGKPEKSKVSSRALMAEKALSEKLRKAKAEGLLTPLEGKSVEQKQKILKELAKNGIPLPEGKTASDKKLIDKVIEEMGLPPQPKTPSAKDKYQKAVKAGLVTPLEGKSTPEKEKILKGLADLGVELPVGRTASEKSLIAKVKASAPVASEVGLKPEKVKTKVAGLVSPLRGKTPEQKEEVLRNLAMNNVPLPEGKTPSEKLVINKVRADVGLPPEPKSKSEKDKYKQAEAAGLIVPLEGKTPAEKEKILQAQADFGLPLPEGRTPSEKSLIKKIKQGEKKKVKSREKGVGPPALPLEKRKKLDAKTLKVMKEGKGPSDECICGLLTPEEDRISRVSKISPPFKIPSDKLKSAKAAGLLTPLEGKSPAQKEQILKELAKQGIPLPEPKTASEKKIMQKVQNDLGLPPIPQTPSLKEKYAKAQAAGVITPLEGKTPSQKEKILNKQAQMGIDLPAGRTASEKALINKIRAGIKPPEKISEKIRKVSLEGKTPEEKEKILRNLAKAGLPLPEGKTPSEKQLIKKVKEDVQMKSPEVSEKLRKAKAAGLLTPLEGKTPAQKEEIIRRQLAAGLPLPEPKSPSEKKIMKDVIAKSSKLLHGKTPSQKEKILRNIAKQGLPLPESKTPSDKAIIEKVRAEMGAPPEMAAPSAKLRQARAAGLLTPLEGKSEEEKEKILKGLAQAGIPLPEAKSPSEKKVIEKVRQDLGLPPEPKTLSIKEKMKQAQAAGIITPLEGKTPSQKEKVLKKMHEAGIPLPKGRTSSEKALIKKIKGEVTKEPSKGKVPSEKLKEAKAKGLLTPLEGKTPAQKEKILRGLAKSGLPLPEGKTPSEKALIHKIQAEEGIVPTRPSLPSRPSPPTRPSLPPDKLKKLDKSTAKGMKESKGPSDECICDLLTPESEREKISVPALKKLSQKIPSEKLRKAKAAGLLTPLEGKTPEQKEKILKGLAMHKIPLPEPKTASEKKIHDKVRADLGLTPQPKTPSAKENYNKAIAAGLITPLEGKSPAQKEKILKAQADLGLPLPEGRTPSEKALIAKVKATAPKPVEKLLPPEKIQKLKAAGLLTPLEGKTPEQKEKILKGLAMQKIPLPEPKTASEKKIHDKVRADLGLTPQPKTPSAKENYNKAIAAGLITPLEGKSAAQKEKILKAQADLGLPLPEGRTPSEKALIAKVKATAPMPVEKLLPPEKIQKLKAAGLLTPLEGKTPEQKEKILKGLAMQKIPLPEPKTASEKRIHDKVRADLGLTPQPKTPSAKENYNKAIAAGLITPLEGKSAAQKEKILKAQADLGLPLPEGRTPSEKALIAKVKATAPKPVEKLLPPEKIQKLKAAGLLTPLEGKTPEQKEKILKGLAMQKIPLPEPKTASEKRIHDKVRADLGLTPQPKTPSAKENYNKAIAAGLITPLEGKSAAQKEKILKAQADLGLPLPEGRTPSEKALIAKVKATAPKSVEKLLPPEKIQKLKAAGILTPLEGKTPEQKEKILKDMAIHGVPLPEGKTASEKKIIDKVRASVGLPPEPKTSSEKVKYKKAIAAGLITPLQGKSEAQKEKILRGQKEIGLKLPEPRTPSEKALIQKIKETVPSLKEEKIRKSKAPELVALEGKTPEQKEKILKDLALKGIPLPEPKTSSEKKLINKVRAEVGLPPIPKTASLKEKYDKAKAEGLITPLQGKSAAQKEKILRGQAQMGLPLPEGRTASEKALIAKVKATPAAEVPKLAKSIEKVSRPAMPPEKVAKLDKKTAKVMKEGKGPSDECICGILTPETEKAPVGAPPIKAPKEAEMLKVPSKKIRKAKAAGLMTPLKGKSPEQKEKILKELAMQGIPLPEAKTASEKKLIDKVRNEVGLPPEPKTPSMKLKYDKAIADDVIVPLEGKTNAEKEKILRNQAALGLPLPVGRTASEKAIIAKVKEAIPSEKIRKAKTAGLLTPLEGKTPEKKEKILKGLVEAGLPLPEGKTPSEKALIQKVKTKAGVIPELAISEKGKIKTKSKRVGAPGVRRSVRGVGVTKSKGGIVEEFQDIIKTTTCDRGCGCDKKKIRFKHSYVKIRVTSPDISSLCPCPDECVPGVKGGVFTDNEGIKVTVGRVMCVSSNSSRRLYQHENCSSLTFVPKFNILLNDKNTNVNKLNNISKSETEINLQGRLKKNQRFSNGYIPNEFNGKVNKTDTSNLFLKNEESSTSLQYDYSLNISNSFDSIYFLKTNSSLSLITIPSTASVWSFSTTSISTNSSLDKQSFIKYYTNNYENLQSMLMLQDTNSKISNVCLDLYKYSSENKKSLLEFPMYTENNLDNDIQIYRVSDVNKEILDNVNHDNYIAYVDGISDKDEILKVFNRILSTTPLKNSSSIIIIVASSSDGCPTSNDSSTICLELSEDRPNWNPGTSGLHHVRQKQKGFKITKRRHLRHVVETDSHLLSKIHKIKKSHTTLLNQENNDYRPVSGWNKLNIISTDTTEDRPCCCNVVNAENVQNKITTQRIDNVVSEFVTPMILEEVVAQGLINDSYILDLPLVNNAKRPSHLTIHQSNRCKTTPVRLCKIPPCSGHQSCHADKSPSIKTLAQPHNILNPNLYKSCDCSPTKLKEIFEKNTIQLISKACGDSKEELHRKHVKLGHERIRKPYVITTRENKCNSCSSSKSNLQSCISSDKNKKHLCPCEQHHKISNLDNYSKELNYKTEDSNLKNNCQCKDQTRMKNKKNIICECPEEPEPEIEIDENEWLDEKQMRKIQSDLTQTTSGFKIKIPKKKSDSELSFEEALRYFAENLENDKINEEICDCNGKSKKTKNAKCECPYEPYDIPNVEETPIIEEPFTGIKFHIDGKGTASKGLSGILCFE